MKKLQLNFKSSADKNRSFNLNILKDGIDEKTAKSAMDKIVASRLFQQKGEQLYVQPVNAKIIERTETIVAK